MGELAGTPIQLWEASDDTLAENVDTFAATLGADLHDVGALGHTATAVQAVDAEDVVSFVIASTT